MNSRSQRACERFLLLVTDLGGEVLEPTWLGSNKPHRVRCAKGHETSPRPSDAHASGSICRICAGRDSGAAWTAFRQQVSKLGGEVLEPEWLGTHTPHRVRCQAGHESSPTPGHVRKWGSFCRTCAGQDPAVSKAAFFARVAELGGEVLEPEWLGALKPHRVRCPEGHVNSPRPANIRRGTGLCRTCARRDSATSSANFRRKVAELGGEVLEPEWLGTKIPHRVRCALGHEGPILPNSVIYSKGGCCRICSGNDSQAAEASFRLRVAELGGEVFEPEWLGVHTPHGVRCAQGHAIKTLPSTLQSGRATGLPCRVCKGLHQAALEGAFRLRVAELGGEVLEREWLGKDVAHRVRCREGHTFNVRPSSLAGRKVLCLACAGEIPFRLRVAELGGEVLEPEWLGPAVPHQVRCREGHITTAVPASVRTGKGICRRCVGKNWDTFYLVTDSADTLKIGITSGRPQHRLVRQQHL